MLALTSALCSAVATMLIQWGLRRGNFYAGFWINIAVGMIGLWSIVLLLVPRADYHWSAVPYFIFSGVVGTAAGRLFRVAAIEKVGAPVAPKKSAGHRPLLPAARKSSEQPLRTPRPIRGKPVAAVCAGAVHARSSAVPPHRCIVRPLHAAPTAMVTCPRTERSREGPATKVIASPSNSTAKSISGSLCGRTGSRTASSNPSTISSPTAARPGTRASTNRRKSCPSPGAIGPSSVNQCEDWYEAITPCCPTSADGPQQLQVAYPLCGFGKPVADGPTVPVEKRFIEPRPEIGPIMGELPCEPPKAIAALPACHRFPMWEEFRILSE